MGRAPCCDKEKVKKGPWSPEEDLKLKDFIQKCGTGGNWIALPQKAGLRRCGKSCRLRWLNYLRPNIKHGEFSADEDRIICTLFSNIGSRWSIIASQMPGRTDNDIKNYWNTKLKKKLMNNNNSMNHEKKTPTFSSSYYNQQDIFLTTTTTTTNYLDHHQTSSLPSSFADPTSMQNYYQVKETTFGHDHQVEASSCGFKGDQVQMGIFDHQTSYCFNNNSNLSNVDHVNGPNELIGHEITRPATIMEDCYYYGLEEIKQLISPSKSSLISGDENKSMYYYHY